MKKNMGTIDRVIRAIVAAIIGALFVFGYISGVFGIVLVVIAAVLLLSGIIGFCPLYVPFGISTRKKEG
ncbi:MAG: DUF2892 domain-containing protein [Desulfobacteraceae bacterium]|nr:DUF2892 domain-containing protein [Desulfobacteraceae bacterium]